MRILNRYYNLASPLEADGDDSRTGGRSRRRTNKFGFVHSIGSNSANSSGRGTGSASSRASTPGGSSRSVSSRPQSSVVSLLSPRSEDQQEEGHRLFLEQLTGSDVGNSRVSGDQRQRLPDSRLQTPDSATGACSFSLSLPLDARLSPPFDHPNRLSHPS